MSTPTTGRSAYSQHEIAIKDPENLRQVLRELSSLRDRVVVNLVLPAEALAEVDVPAASVQALSAQTLTAALSGRPATLQVQALPLGLYQQVMRDKIARIAGATRELRARLRSRFVVELAADLDGLVQQLDQLLFLVNGYAMQDWRPRVTRLVETLTTVRKELTESVTACDNVRCMDDLHYDIVPVLNGLLEVFASRQNG